MLKGDVIVGAKAAAEFCGLTPRFIYGMVERGDLPAIKTGKRLIFRRSELERALSGSAEAA